MTKTNTGGGAATASGMDYQSRVEAFVSCAMLHGEEHGIDWLPISAITQLRVESPEPIGDLNIGLENGAWAFCEAKRKIDFSELEHSPLAGVVRQAVSQYLRRVDTLGPTDRPTPENTRLVLIAGPSSSARILVGLKQVLQQARDADAETFLRAGAPKADIRDGLIKHIARSWRAAAGEEPDGEDIWKLASLIDVVELAVESGGADEGRAKEWLRYLLQDPQQKDTAWDALLAICLEAGKHRSALSPSGVRSRLKNRRILVAPPPKYEADIKALRSQTRRVADLLRCDSRLETETGEVFVARPAVEELTEKAAEGHVVLIGDPGTGKSGLLWHFYDKASKADADIILLSADRIESTSLPKLDQELRLQHRFEEVIANWDGANRAYLVIDALDAARGDMAAQMLRDLITNVLRLSLPRWHVVVSIRRFDLEHSQALRSLLGAPLETRPRRTANLVDISHVDLSVFGDAELTQVTERSPGLAKTMSEASPRLMDLIRVPFNLRLLSELLTSGLSTKDMSGVQTQIQLLDLYWRWRVSGEVGNRHQREDVLRKICVWMLRSQTLRVPAADVQREATTGDGLTHLLRSNVLRSWEGHGSFKGAAAQLSFSHLILFDYATARLVLSDAAEVSARLSSRPAEILMIRPAIDFYFQHRWHRDGTKHGFWSDSAAVLQEGVPRVAGLVGPAVAAREARGVEELLPATEVESTSDPLTLLRFTVGAVTANWSRCESRRDLWAKWLAALARKKDIQIAFAIRPLLFELAEKTPSLSEQGLRDLSQASRDVLDLAWEIDEAAALIPLALRCVIKATAGAPEETGILVSRCIEPTHLRERGHVELPVIARDIDALYCLPQLVERIYAAAFGHREKSEKRTAMSTSRIMSLTSNAAQDYSLALWAFAKAFQGFLRAAPSAALRAMLAAVDGLVRREHDSAAARGVAHRFEFPTGIEATIVGDYSSIWDRSSARHGDATELLDEVESYLLELAADADRQAELAAALATIASGARWAVVWRRLLRAASQSPQVLGKNLKSLAWTPAILSSFDTTKLAGNFLHAVHGLLEEEDRKRIEEAIINLPNDSQPENPHFTRNRLLGCLEEQNFASNESLQLIRAARQADAVPENVESTTRAWSSPYGEREFLVEQGVSVDDPANRALHDLGAEVERLTGSTSSTGLEIQAIVDAMPAVTALAAALLGDRHDEAHPAQHAYSCGTLATACAAIARNERLREHRELAKFTATTLCALADHADPKASVEANRSFDAGPGWSKPAARIDAAEGLILLARYSFLFDIIRPSVQKLANDAHNAVRYQLATRLLALYESDPEWMWELIELFCTKDPSPTVTAAVMSDAVRRLALRDSDRAETVVELAWNRLWESDHAAALRESCATVVVGLHVHRPSDRVDALLRRWLTEPSNYVTEIGRMVFLLREEILHGDPEDADSELRRGRAFGILRKVVQNSLSRLRALDKEYADKGEVEWLEPDAEQAKALVGLCDNVAMQVYFASGAFDDRKKEDERISDGTRRRLYAESRELLDSLGEVGHAAVAHHLIQTLAHLSDVDPPGVLIRVAEITQRATAGRYQFESMAAELVVQIVQQYLAEHRSLLRDQRDVQGALLTLLDIFVEVGWPAAYQLTFRLEEIYR